MSSSATDKQAFEVVGTVETIRELGKTTRLRVKVGGQFGKWHDIVMFRPVNDVDRGARVRVVGDIGTKKLEGQQQQGKNGRMYDVWIPELVGREIDVLGPGQARIPGTEPEERRSRNDDGDKIPF